MKPPLFHVGQAVVCINADTEPCGARDCEVKDPTLNRIYIVDEVNWRPRYGAHFIGLAEMPSGDEYEETGFAPVELASDKALAELLEEVFTPVTA